MEKQVYPDEVIEKLKKVLQFYADGEHYEKGWGYDGEDEYPYIELLDEGEKAREALQWLNENGF